MGMRLRLKSSFDTSGFPPQSKVILTALQQWGMIMADNGSSVFISGDPDDSWDNNDLGALKTVPASAFEVVLMGRTARVGALRRVHGEDRDAARRALGLVGGEPLSGRLYRDLSGGQQQRVLLARAIAADSEMLVLDEPTAGMDVASEAAMIAFLQELNRNQKLTIVIVTHLLPVVLNLATSVMLLGTHSILHGPLDQVLQEEFLTELYGVPVHIGTIAGKRTLVVGQPGANGV